MTAVIPMTISLSSVLTLNQREAWQAKSRKTRDIRTIAAYAKLQHARDIRLESAHCVCLIEFATRRRRDVHNWMPTVKAIIDGLIGGAQPNQAGPWPHRLLDDDSGSYLTGPDLREGHDPTLSGVLRFTLNFTPL